MDIVIIANFCMDFSDADNGRFSYLADMLSSTNKVEIITSDYYHTTKKYRKKIPKLPYKVTMLHEPSYKKNVSIKRFFSHYIWGRNVGKYLRKRRRPDVVYCAVPSLTGPYKASKFCKKNEIRFVIDIQDLWPEAFQMVINIPVISSIMFFPFKKMADRIYSRADAICAVSDTYCKRAKRVNKKVKKTNTVFLGTELSMFDRYASEPPILKKNNEEIWLAYCGTLGSSYDLTCVIDAMHILSDSRIRFIVMGDGPRKDEFENYAKEKGVKADFVGRLPYNSMCSLLSACDITVNPITHMAAQSIINKHADYAASGLPVVSTQENIEYKRLIKDYGMGFNCKNNDSNDLADKIKRLIEDNELRLKMGKNARKCAEEMFDRNNSYIKLVNKIVCVEGDE